MAVFDGRHRLRRRPFKRVIGWIGCIKPYSNATVDYPVAPPLGLAKCWFKGPAVGAPIDKPSPRRRRPHGILQLVAGLGAQAHAELSKPPNPVGDPRSSVDYLLQSRNRSRNCTPVGPAGAGFMEFIIRQD